MDKIDYLIIGQGIAGTMLSFNILERGNTCRVANTDLSMSSSYISAGVINPVTGRRSVKSWLIDQLLLAANTSYERIGELLNDNFITCHEITRLITDVEEENLWFSKVNDQQDFLDTVEDEMKYDPYFKNFRSIGKIKSAMVVDIKKLLIRWQEFLHTNHLLFDTLVKADQLKLSANGIQYKDCFFKNIIFADGYNGLSKHYFDFLPYKNAKGEVLHIKPDGYDLKEMIKSATNIIPENEHLYWVGSNYEWDSKDERPSKAGYDRIVKKLNSFTKFEYDVVDHTAGIRACSLDRRPYIGRHPDLENFWIMNGMGTKGVSLAPFFSVQLLDNIESGTPLMEEVDVKRVVL